MDNIHDIRSICSDSTHIDKLSMENTKFRIINQHRNVMCHIQSLENDFYNSALGSFGHVFPQICTNYFFICSLKHQQVA
jgi:hypothetical protein